TKMLWVLLLLLLSSLPGTAAVPAQRPACYKRPLQEHSCHSIPAGSDSLRHVQDALPHHFWEGKGCEVICYCNVNELLCCPKDIFFGPKISFVIPCSSQ
ncbi:SCRG1 protein, partial [Passerina amoena]|nr:SCRG1 protein [Passerina amoena]